MFSEYQKMYMESLSISNTLTQTLTLTHSCIFCSLQGPRSKGLEEMNAGMEKNQLWLRKTNRKAFYTAVASDNFREGAERLLQVSVVTLCKTFLRMKIKNKPTNAEKSNELMCNLRVMIDILKYCRNWFY